MRMKRCFRFLSLLMTVCFIVLSVMTVSFSASALGVLPPKNNQPRHQLCTSLSASAAEYYTGTYSYDRLSELSGAPDNSSSDTAMQDNALYDSLHSLMADTHAYYVSYSGYNPGSLAYFWASTDAVSDSESYVMFYSDIPSGEGVKLNREHVWPKSRASFQEKNGGSDLHHLRPAVASLNSAKSDHTFGNIFGVYEDGYKEGVLNDQVMYYVSTREDLFECKDDVKGDVARILLYVYCRWQQPNLYSDVTEGLPALDPDDKADSGKKVIESLDTLLQWCEQDPVDSWEMARNDLVQEVQGNRNVFIDYPELAWQLFGEEIPEDMPTPGHPYSDDEQILLGDTDSDGEVTILDATAIQRQLAELPTEAFSVQAADADEDGEVTILDATAVQRYLAELETAPNIGEPISQYQYG